MPWPDRLADQIPAIHDLAAETPAAWSVEQVADAIRGANKAEVEEVLDSLAALGILAPATRLAAHDGGSLPGRWRRRLA